MNEAQTLRDRLNEIHPASEGTAKNSHKVEEIKVTYFNE